MAALGLEIKCFVIMYSTPVVVIYRLLQMLCMASDHIDLRYLQV